MEIIKRSEAKALGLTHYFTGKPCKHGHLSRRRYKDRVCMECDIAYQIRVYKANPEKAKERRLKTYERTREKHLAQKKIYRQTNRAKVNALGKAYKVRKKNRIPAWVDKDHMWLIKEAYELAQLRTKHFGFSWHVDHIVPLQGELVSGLHVIENLQVIPGVENIKKKNKFEIDDANQIR
jgi:hypothetical protein